MNSAANTVFRQLSEKVLFDVLAFAGDRELENLRKVSPEVSRIVDLIKGLNSFLLISIVNFYHLFLSCSSRGHCCC